MFHYLHPVSFTQTFHTVGVKNCRICKMIIILPKEEGSCKICFFLFCCLYILEVLPIQFMMNQSSQKQFINCGQNSYIDGAQCHTHKDKHSQGNIKNNEVKPHRELWDLNCTLYRSLLVNCIIYLSCFQKKRTYILQCFTVKIHLMTF